MSLKLSRVGFRAALSTASLISFSEAILSPHAQSLMPHNKLLRHLSVVLYGGTLSEKMLDNCESSSTPPTIDKPMKRKVFQFLLDALYIFLKANCCEALQHPFFQSCLYVPPFVRPRAPVSRTLPPVGVRQKLEQQSARRFSGVLPNAGLTGNLSLKSNASMGTITCVQHKLEMVNQCV
ncbi:hypothetical protein GOBAR_AA03333 [Gossypium barbadense]|uniref:Uncharacterized protein n=1 Tax=Gossypium barbadense TaxID=3634 RepID=A0A2P5YNT3_GOSBA|nr:hypothetical protein GOBAR_AA03333 [Gossypium barbadense]